MLTAMVTPMTSDGAVDYDGAAQARHLPGRRDAQRRPGDQRHHRRIADHDRRGEGPPAAHGASRRSATAPRSWPASAPTTPRTPASWPGRPSGPARTALLVVTPYYNKPPQEGLCRHFTRGRGRDRAAGHALRHPGPDRHADRDRDADPAGPSTRRIVAVKDAKGDFGAASEVMAATDLAFYCGDDMLNLPWLSIGAVGFVSVVGHVVGDRLHEMIDAYRAATVTEAAARSTASCCRSTRDDDPDPGRDHDEGGARPARPARRRSRRLPLADATPAEIEQLRDRSGGGRREAAGDRGMSARAGRRRAR